MHGLATLFSRSIRTSGDKHAEGLARSKDLRAPLKIHISSLPRRREPSQINKLDSRLPPAFARVTGNDEFLEVPLTWRPNKRTPA